MAIILGLAHMLESDSCNMALHGFSYATANEEDKPVVASKGKVYTDAGYQTRNKVGDVIHKVKPLFITDTVVRNVMSDKVDDMRVQLLCFLELLKDLPNVTVIKIYTDNPYIIKGINALGSKLMRSNRDLWEAIYSYIDEHKVMILDYNKLLTNESTDHTIGRKALITRARNITHLIKGVSVHFTHPVETYWSNTLPRPKLPFTDLIFIANGPEDENDDNTLYSINKNQTLTSFGRRAVDCGYGVTIFNDKKPTVLTQVMDIVESDFEHPTFIALSLRSLYVDPGIVVSDILKYGTRSWYIDENKPLVRKTITEKPLFHADTIPHMGWNGITILNDLKAILEEFISGEFNKITGTRDITEFFYDDSGKKASKKIMTAKHTIRIPAVKGRPRNVLVGNEIPDRNTLLALLKDKEFRAHTVTFGRHTAYILETSISKSICNNWYYSLDILK